jgi:uncharacterized protein YoxC
MRRILHEQEYIVGKIEELMEKVDGLQSKLDTEQEQIQSAIDGLKATVQELTDRLATGGGATDDQLQAVINKIDGIATDLEGTIADTELGTSLEGPTG